MSVLSKFAAKVVVGAFALSQQSSLFFARAEEQVAATATSEVPPTETVVEAEKTTEPAVVEKEEVAVAAKQSEEDELDKLDDETPELSEDEALDKVRGLLKRIMNNENIEEDPNLDMEKLLEGIDQEKLHALFSEMMPPEMLAGLNGEGAPGDMEDMMGEMPTDDSDAALDAMDDGENEDGDDDDEM